MSRRQLPLRLAKRAQLPRLKSLRPRINAQQPKDVAIKAPKPPRKTQRPKSQPKPKRKSQPQPKRKSQAQCQPHQDQPIRILRESKCGLLWYVQWTSGKAGWEDPFLLNPAHFDLLLPQMPVHYVPSPSSPSPPSYSPVTPTPSVEY